MNTYTKYCPNVWVAKCSETHEKGEEIIVTTKHGKENECIVWNFLGEKDGCYLYSITRSDGFNSQERARAKAERYEEWADKAHQRSDEAFERSERAVAGIPMGQPILVGHHSERAHRAAIDKSWAAMGKSVEEMHKAEAHDFKAVVGQPVEAQIYWDMLCNMPPVFSRRDTFQVGEAHSHDREGHPLYGTFCRRGDDYFFLGYLRCDEKVIEKAKLRLIR